MEILTERLDLSWAPEYGVEFYETFEVNRPLVHGETIVLGATSIECLHIPGHTPGAMSYFFEISDKGRTYRVGIHGGPGLNTLSEEYLKKYGLPMSRRTDYMRSLRRLQEREVDLFIGAHPGQNDTLAKRSQMKEGMNPFLDRTAWPTYLKTLEQNAKAQFGLS